MGWRSVVINNPAQLNFSHQSLHIIQHDSEDKQIAKVPLEDISVLIINSLQVTISAKLLSACSDFQVAVIIVGENHLPNGILLPYLPHSRALKIMQAQLRLSKSKKKRLWQCIVQQKILNQGSGFDADLNRMLPPIDYYPLLNQLGQVIQTM